jgi:hypothetical protein
MWLLKWLPNWLFYATLIGGIFGLLLSRMIPAYYRSAARALFLFMFIAGDFMSGAIYDNDQWNARVKEMEQKVAVAEQKAKEANTKIDNKSAKQVAKIKEKQVIVKQYITREITKYDNSCVIPKEFVEVHNKAASK